MLRTPCKEKSSTTFLPALLDFHLQGVCKMKGEKKNHGTLEFTKRSLSPLLGL